MTFVDDADDDDDANDDDDDDGSLRFFVRRCFDRNVGSVSSLLEQIQMLAKVKKIVQKIKLNQSSFR